MTKKRFILKKYITDHYGILDNGEEIAYADHRSAFTICDLLNKLNEESEQLKSELKNCRECLELNRESCVRHMKENEQLKQAYTQLKHRHSLLHDVCIDAECDRDSYRKDIASLEKENEQLLSEIDDFQNLLSKNDNVCHDRVINLIDDKIAFLYETKGNLINEDSYRLKQISFAITVLRELKGDFE